jgi:hypothetical protein
VPTATVTLRNGSLFTGRHIFDVVFSEPVLGLTAQDFTIPVGVNAAG